MTNFFTQHPKCFCFKPAAQFHSYPQQFQNCSDTGNAEYSLMSTYSFAFVTLFMTLFLKLKSHYLIYEHLLFEWTKKSCCRIHNLLELALFSLPVLIFPHSSACQRANVWVTGGQLPWYRNTALLSKGTFTAEFLRLSLLTEEPLASRLVTDPSGAVSGNSSDLSPQKTVKTSPWAITSVILW